MFFNDFLHFASKFVLNLVKPKCQARISATPDDLRFESRYNFGGEIPIT